MNIIRCNIAQFIRACPRFPLRNENVCKENCIIIKNFSDIFLWNFLIETTQNCMFWGHKQRFICVSPKKILNNFLP